MGERPRPFCWPSAGLAPAGAFRRADRRAHGSKKARSGCTGERPEEGDASSGPERQKNTPLTKGVFWRTMGVDRSPYRQRGLTAHCRRGLHSNHPSDAGALYHKDGDLSSRTLKRTILSTDCSQKAHKCSDFCDRSAALALPPQGRSDGQTVGPMGAKRPDRAARGSAPRRATPAERGPFHVWRAAALPSAPGAGVAASAARHGSKKRPRRRDTSPSASEAKRQRGPAQIPRAPPMMPGKNNPELYERSG